MTEQVNAGLMRKLSAGQGEAGNAPRSVLRALRLALARAADDRLNLPLTVIGAKQATRSPADLGGLVRDDWLLLMFASDHGGPAAFCLDPGCVSAVLQKQTIGVVTADPPQPRVFTDTDAAMAVPLVEGLLQRAQKLVEAPEDLSSLSGFEFSARAKDLRSLTLALSDDTYRMFDLTIDLAGGARQGQISVVLPDHPEIEESEAVEMIDHGPQSGPVRGCDPGRAAIGDLSCILATVGFVDPSDRRCVATERCPTGPHRDHNDRAGAHGRWAIGPMRRDARCSYQRADAGTGAAGRRPA